MTRGRDDEAASTALQPGSSPRTAADDDVALRRLPTSGWTHPLASDAGAAIFWAAIFLGREHAGRRGLSAGVRSSAPSQKP